MYNYSIIEFHTASYFLIEQEDKGGWAERQSPSSVLADENLSLGSTNTTYLPD